MNVVLSHVHRALRAGGSILVHANPVIGPTLRQLLDGIFLRASFRDEYVLPRRGIAHSGVVQRHEMLMHYVKDAESRPKTWHAVSNTLWSDIPPSLGIFRGDFSTPEGVLRRAIEQESEAGDLVIGPFWGASTAVVAQRLGRRWIVGDVRSEGYELAKARLLQECKCGPGKGYAVLNDAELSDCPRFVVEPPRLPNDAATLLNDRVVRAQASQGVGSGRAKTVVEPKQSASRGATRRPTAKKTRSAAEAKVGKGPAAPGRAAPVIAAGTTTDRTPPCGPGIFRDLPMATVKNDWRIIELGDPGKTRLDFGGGKTKRRKALEIIWAHCMTANSLTFFWHTVRDNHNEARGVPPIKCDTLIYELFKKQEKGIMALVEPVGARSNQEFRLKVWFMKE
jgi:hypothetical protein